MHTRLPVTALLLALGASASAREADPPHYVKKATWQETLIASREALQKQEDEKAQAVKPAAKTEPLELGPWHMSGPFFPQDRKRDFLCSFPPEKEAGLNSPDAPAAETKAALARQYDKLQWRPQPQFVDGVPHDLIADGNGSTYLYRTIVAADTLTITGYFGSDDGIRAWLNGKVILSNDVARGVGANQDQAKLEFRKGVNHLLLKIYNGGGGHGFYFHTKPQPAGGGGGAPTPQQLAREALWHLVARDFRKGNAPGEMAWERQDAIWTADWTAGDLKDLADRYAKAARLPALAKEAADRAALVKTAADLAAVRESYYRSRRVEEGARLVKDFNFKALRLAIEDLSTTYPDKYTRGAEFLKQADALEQKIAGVAGASAKGDIAAVQNLADLGNELHALRIEALLTQNPLVDFDKLLLVKRGEGNLGLPQNWVTNASIGRTGYDNEIAVLSPVSPTGTLSTLYRPPKGEFVGDVDLHWDADRMMFSSVGTHGRWQVLEINADGAGLHQVTPGEENDVDNFDPCYLPSGKVIFSSTRCFHGVPCVGGGDPVGNLCLLDPKTGTTRQLCVDQDQNWCPTVLNNGRVLYTRWEYSDTPHYFTRILFHMNPDGTEQMEYAFSNSYWPNSTFYARPIPGHPTKVVAVISGHHGVPRMGELIVYDPAKGRHENSGAVQKIPGYGKEVVPTIADGLVEGSWPRFLHPYPLSEKVFLVSCKMSPQSPWSLCLVDVFDNILPILEIPGYALFEPVPFRKTVAPPVVPEKVDLTKTDATIYLQDVYFGRGLQDVPRGTVKNLRVYSYHFGYNGMGGHINIGIDGPWDARRILGTVPVNPDGSALFKVPANLPVSVQPLDAEGKAIQVFRSWYTAMPGEVATCMGCHERQNSAPSLRRTIAATQAPVEITPWRGPERPFSFQREVQPVLDRLCAGCHDGTPGAGKAAPNFADAVRGERGFTKSYLALHPFVRRPGPESDFHLQKPYEWHADTSELVQMLKKGHHGVQLDAEAWDRIVTWIDLNVPNHGTWAEHRGGSIDGIVQRRLAMRTKYANRPENPEVYPAPPPERFPFVKPAPEPERKPVALEVPGWPFDAGAAKKAQAAVGVAPELKVELGDHALDFVLIPAGEYVMGSVDGAPDEYPPCRVKIEKPFYMGRCEVTNGQYARFDPAHDSGVISQFNKDHSNRGVPANQDAQPVVRVSWEKAMAYCAWLTKQTGRDVTLPTEAQWEWACRAGTATPLYYGNADVDFGKLANLADVRLHGLLVGDSPHWIPAVTAVNDGATATNPVGRYAPNAWGLFDMIGNAAEWTLTTYRPYPYAADGRDAGKADGRKVARGGSFYDRPSRARSASRVDYYAWQPVHDVGFRVVCPVEPPKKVVRAD
jgi:formylglycine-generating enzyme required for sulfatase activity